MSTLTSNNLRSKMMQTSAEQSSLHLRSGSSVGSSSSSRANSVAHHNRSSPDHSSTITEVSRSSTPAISQFDQSYADSNTIDIDDLASLDPSSTVIDGKISFVLGCTRQPLKHVFKTSPAFANPKMASNYLTAKIDNFLKNTDHPIQEWQQNTSTAKANIKRILRGTPEPSCNDSDDNRTIADDGDWDELSEMGADLNEEQNASQMTNDRLETETSERIALFDKLEQQEQKMRILQEYTDKLELDLIAAKSDLNGFYEFSNDEDTDDSKNMYKLKCNRLAKDLEFARKRSQTQHEHDLEQLILLKKQLSGKLADAYEEVEEQRQIVTQWKQKMQKTASEMNDLRMMLDEQNARNCILEKRQRKFDAEYQDLQEIHRKDNVLKDRLVREKDGLIADRFAMEQQLSEAKQNLESKDDQLASLKRDIEELTCSEISEEQLAQLKRSKIDAERMCKEQEEELDDMAGQIQLLEQSKLRLEINLEKMRKESRKESAQRDEEMEELRCSFLKKIKTLECQLEAEHEERTMILREKNDLDRRLNVIDQQDHADRVHVDALNAKLKKDLRKSKALLKDALSQLDRAKAEAQKKVLIRQLKNELEDAENDRKIAIKMRQTLELELTDLQGSLDEANRLRSDAEDKANAYFREKTEFQTQIEESEEETAELMKKYTATVKQLNGEQLKISDYEIRISEMELETNTLRERIAELNAKLENLEQHTDQFDAVQTKRLTYRANELETRLELEQAIRVRAEVQCNRQKEQVEKLQNELIQVRSKDMHAAETTKQLQKSLRDLKEELKEAIHREQDCQKKVQEREKQIERTAFDHTCDKNDLQLALQRIADLQYALQDDDDDEGESSDSTAGLDESDDHDSFVECENDTSNFKS